MAHIDLEKLTLKSCLGNHQDDHGLLSRVMSFEINRSSKISFLYIRKKLNYYDTMPNTNFVYIISK